MEIKVYHDGKLCRDYPAKIIKRESNRVLIEYIGIFGDKRTEWFKRIRKDRGGTYYPVSGNNYFYYRKDIKI